MNRKNMKIEEIQTHEEIEESKLREVVKSIKKDGLREPIKISKENKIVLDGHHRLKSFKILGFREIPVISIEYLSDEVTVISRRNFEISKEDVIEVGKSKYNFPAKTTKHKFSVRHRLELKDSNTGSK